MKEKFVDKSFSPENMKLLIRIDAMLTDYMSQGYRVSVRQAYYQLVKANVIENSDESYSRLVKLITNARLAGYLDWDAVEDRGRQVVDYQTWESPAQILQQATETFRIDKWADQGKHVEVMAEKAAVEGVLIPVCQEFDVPFHANKGYSSVSALYETGKRLQERRYSGKDVVVIYLGDHDPSGIHMSRDVLDRLEMFSQSRLTVLRVALNMPQIERYDPPCQYSKEKDSRTPDYVARFGSYDCWELDSLEPRVMAGILRAAIKAQINPEKWEKAVAREDEMKDQLQSIVEAIAPKKNS